MFFIISPFIIYILEENNSFMLLLLIPGTMASLIFLFMCVKTKIITAIYINESHIVIESFNTKYSYNFNQISKIRRIGVHYGGFVLFTSKGSFWFMGMDSKDCEECIELLAIRGNIRQDKIRRRDNISKKINDFIRSLSRRKIN